MPEYPDVELYLHALRNHIVGQPLDKVIVKSPFVLRTFEPDLEHSFGRIIEDVSRIGKRIVWHLTDELFLVFHLMITGRFHKKKANALPKSKMDLAAFQFPDFTLMYTEAAKKKRASLHVIAGEKNLNSFNRGGLDVTDTTWDKFHRQLRSQNRTVKLSLIDPTIFDGIGNAYSDEILHRARMSPFLRTATISEEESKRLFESITDTLALWRAKLIEEAGVGFPERVTAFRPDMAVHGKYGKPCPVCDKPVQRIRYSEREWNYCAGCQTNGKLLADRSLSRLLKDEWPETIDDLPE